jgi:SAM-dependent methyltransferase
VDGLTAAAGLRHHYGAPCEWRRLGAIDKAGNVVALCGDLPHARVLEIGAGEGALLARLAELGFGAELHALEVTPAAVEVIRARGIPRFAQADAFDGYAVPHGDHAFDLAILSHVVEHLEHPRALLREAARVARHVFVEVPLEDTWRLPRDFVPDAVGHLNFYSPRSLRHLVQSCGLEVLCERVANPGPAVYAWRRGAAAGRLRWAAREALLRAAPRLATRVFTYHGSLVCRARTASARGPRSFVRSMRSLSP